ncbi:RNA binding protein [Angomonas deanei]|uniref:Nucleoplasmin-like domain containing protein, putative n=1 Tax=Angomonas deanei TaxID=59799 RepID=A0A7G2CQC3_9TRYP|nr:RNA binding protein [Angomonas deanei]CAD2222056.1 Nucleoplasmin-like domain containing protein, putative [Angomonas deanei]|eukprot:EPY42023.1 RNA binding protein [Angomonas deanei]
MEGFYGLEVVGGRSPIKPKIPEDRVLRLTQIAIPPNCDSVMEFRVVYKNESLLIATLDPQKPTYHVSVDLIFVGGQEVLFSVVGSGSLHLSGYTELKDSDIILDDDDDDEEDDA